MSARQTRYSFVAVAVGGAVGALARYLFIESFSGSSVTGAWSVVIINVLGCGILGVVLVAGESVFDPTHRFHHLWRPFVATGVLGGFTTTSAFATQAILQLRAGNATTMVLQVALSLAGGLLAFSAMHTATVKIISKGSV